MTPVSVLIGLVLYFGMIYGISYWATRQRREGLGSFFLAQKQAPWWAVAFGMVGSSLSGVTFVSVPGDVGQELVKGTGILKQMGYIQLALGYALGYLVIAVVLLPLYYKHRFTSIYEYLSQRFGRLTRKTGAFYFLLSRSLGAAARLYLATGVLQHLIFEPMGVPYLLTAIVTLGIIILYTRQGGIQAIVWTDVLQTSVLLISLGLTWFYLTRDMNLPNPVQAIGESPFGQIFFWDATLPSYFWKQFWSGAFIAIVMSGLDQDMMQKNLSCRNLADAQKNMISYGILLTVVNAIFVALGALLYMYVAQNGLSLPEKADYLYPTLAFNHFGTLVGMAVLIGLIASALNAADGTLTALSTSISVDFLGINPESESKKSLNLVRNLQLGMAALLLGMMLIFYFLGQSQWKGLNVISLVLSMAGYTYGPLLGLYAWGMLTKVKIRDGWVTGVALASPIICIILKMNEGAIFGFKLGYELLLINGGITFAGIALGRLGKRDV